MGQQPHGFVLTAITGLCTGGGGGGGSGGSKEPPFSNRKVHNFQ